MAYPSQSFAQTTFVSLALARRGLAPTRFVQAPIPVVPECTAQATRVPEGSLLPSTSVIVIRAIAVVALLTAAVANVGGEQSVHADTTPVVAAG